MCQICGLPQNVPCSCVSQQPFCDQCTQSPQCYQIMDSQCVIYHWNTTIPTRLINLGLPNGSSAQTIFERIDQFIGTRPQFSILPLNTPSIDLYSSGSTQIVLEANLNISAQAGNIASIFSDGLFVPDVRDGKVKVASDDFPDYLKNKLVGDTDGIVSISTIVEDSDHLIKITPTINLQTLLSSFLDPLDTNTIDLNISGSTAPYAIYANAIISPDGGNNLVAHSNGLYAGNSGVSAADNGLSLSGSTVQLGGPLIQNTSISFANAYSLSLTGKPIVYLGEGTDAGNAVIEIENTYQSSGRTIGLLSTSTGVFGSSGLIGINGNIIVSSGTDVDHSIKSGVYGQLFYNSGNTVTQSSFPEVIYGGTVGLITTYGATTVSGSIINGAVAGIGFAADTATITSVASLLAKGLYQAPQGSAYSGTITNYYGLYIEDIAGVGLNAHITNKFGAYIAGSHSTGYNVAETAFATSSDIRIKENIKDISYGLSEVEKLRPVSFNMIDTPSVTKIGFIAQEVEEILPEAVGIVDLHGYSDFRVIDKEVIFTILINAVKELSAKVKALESR